ncbi:alpha/beta hydrolase family protein [Limnochorda pilosa]|uniref:Alpha/beta hydrolase n=1 Tax=Limnochorda pilosa TaxID=1555112 RepID=A0A0K2SJ03_LIMPI|nr:alpha/beta fold hydrolase [Limnochorda pilosa]BAS27070.1 alpha/beta hydrolase [Limnochorda pilosa]
MKRKWLLILSLVLVVAGGYLASAVQSDYGHVRVSDLRIAGQDGKILSALLYVPENATDKTPAPAVLTMHGYINTRETHSGFNIEFARRGYVVLALDMAGHGYSDPRAFVNYDLTRGAQDGLYYLASLPFVDRTNIATHGHSMGGWSTLRAANDNPDLVKTVILQGSSSETYLSGEVTAESPFNFAVNFSRYDEFWDLMWNDKDAAGKPIAVDATGAPLVKKPSDIVKAPKLKKIFGVTEDVVPFSMYGDPANETARMLYISDTTHPGDHLSKEAIGYSISFLNETIPAPKPLPVSNQIWHLKEFGTLVTLVGIFLFLFAIGERLLDSAYFQSLRQPAPEHPGSSRAAWWVGALIATAIPAATLFKFKGWGGVWVPASATFPQAITSQLMIWAVLNGLIALALFIGWHYLAGAKQGGGALQYGLSTDRSRFALDWGHVGKALLLAVSVVGMAQVLVHFVEWAFLVDPRFWVVALKPLTAARFGTYLTYLIPFFLFFLASSLIMHGQLRLKGKSLGVEMAANALVGALGITVLVALQVGHLFATETLMFPRESLWGIIAYQFIPLTALAGALSTFFFRKTGSVYAGAMVNALFITWYIVAGQAIHFAG